MTDTTIRDLTSGAAIQDADLFVTRQGADTVDKAVTGTQIKEYFDPLKENVFFEDFNSSITGVLNDGRLRAMATAGMLVNITQDPVDLPVRGVAGTANMQRGNTAAVGNTIVIAGNSNSWVNAVDPDITPGEYWHSIEAKVGWDATGSFKPTATDVVRVALGWARATSNQSWWDGASTLANGFLTIDSDTLEVMMNYRTSSPNVWVTAGSGVSISLGEWVTLRVEISPSSTGVVASGDGRVRFYVNNNFIAEFGGIYPQPTLNPVLGVENLAADTATVRTWADYLKVTARRP